MGKRDLSDVQRFVTDAVRGATAVGSDATLAAGAESLVTPSRRGMASHERLEVYREQFWLRHLASLDEDFPTLTRVLGGRDAFRDLAGGYLMAHPPRTWDLQRLGADLSSYLAGVPRWRDDRLAVDAARLDWAFMEAFDAPDSPPFDARVLASTPEDAWPAARIDLHASIRLLSLAYPVHELRETAQPGTAPARPAPAATHLVVHRDAACFLHAAAVEPLALGLLEALRAGVPLGEACEAVARTGRPDAFEVGEKLGGWFQQWTQGGWIRGVRFVE